MDNYIKTFRDSQQSKNSIRKMLKTKKLKNKWGRNKHK